jgi:alpha-tubulin suppressor-like RCC1 family protein
MKLICNRFGTSLVVAGAMALNAVVMGQVGQVIAWGNNTAGQCNVNSMSSACQITVSGQNWTGSTYSLNADGIVVGAGSASSVPGNLGVCIQIASGYKHMLAIQSSGVVKAWGQNDSGSTDVPVDLGPCIQIAAGGNNSVAIKSNGTVACWGAMGRNVPSDLGTCIKIAAGPVNIAAIKSDGTVVVWGDNWFGQTSVPSSIGACKQIAIGDRHIVVIKTDGIVVCWGWNNIQQCGSDAEQIGGTPTSWTNDSRYGAYWIKTNLGTCTQISASITLEYNIGHNLAIQTNGNVVDWPGNSGLPADLGACTRIAAGHNHNAAIQVPLPVISGVLPISGPGSGGTNITITGTNFFNPSTVTIGGAPATNVVVVSDTQITATTPAGFPGPAVVTVNLGSSTAFYYRPTCGSDIDNNGVVDNADLGIMLLDYGSCSESAAATESVEPVQIPMIEQTPLASKK